MKKVGPRNIYLFSAVVIMGLTLVYATIVSATLNTELQISGEASFRTLGLLREQILNDNGGAHEIRTRLTPNFSVSATTDEGMFAIQDDYGTSYYYRGAVTNNNLIFGEHQWKIIRIDGKGNIKLIYNGPCPENSCIINVSGSDVYIPRGPHNWNAPFINDNKYAGFMFGGANGVASTSYETAHTNETNSNIKTLLEEWYQNNILTKSQTLINKITDVAYCNDRSLTAGSGFGNINTFFGSFNRTLFGLNPSLRCPNENDKFSVYTQNGNGALTYPIAAITVDEAIFAGVVPMVPNPSYYLHTGQTYWTITPGSLQNNSARMWVIFANGGIDPDGWVSFGFNIRPVITLSSAVEYQEGDGTAQNPYLIK